jgi:hypothetical protein
MNAAGWAFLSVPIGLLAAPICNLDFGRILCNTTHSTRKLPNDKLQLGNPSQIT